MPFCVLFLSLILSLASAASGGQLKAQGTQNQIEIIGQTVVSPSTTLPTLSEAAQPSRSALLSPGGLSSALFGLVGSDGPPPVRSLTKADTAHVPLDLRIARMVRSDEFRESLPLRATAAFTGLAAFPGTLLLAGILYGTGEARADADLRDLGVQLGSAVGSSIGASIGVKLVIGRARPDVSPEAPHDVAFGRGFRGDDYRSFPSAHTAAAFAAATILFAELPEDGASRYLLGPAAYGIAGLAGLSRIYHDEHWFTDIVAGAVVGVASGVVTTQLVDD